MAAGTPPLLPEATTAKIPEPEELLELTDGDPIEQAAAAIG